MHEKEFSVGDILVSSWGYEQTNINFYQVLKATSKTVVIRELKKSQSYNGRTMTGLVVPLRGQFRENAKELRRRISPDGYIRGEYSTSLCKLWGGNPECFTDYA